MIFSYYDYAVVILIKAKFMTSASPLSPPLIFFTLIVKPVAEGNSAVIS